MSLVDLLTSRAAGLPTALLAGLAIALVMLRLGRGRFSARLFGVAIAVGALSAILPMRIEAWLAGLAVAPGPIAGAAFKAVIMAGLVEEAAKLLFGYAFIRRHYLARSPRDIVLGVAAVALGFALLENIGYVANAEGQRASVALLRAAVSVPGHVFTGLLLGLGVALTERREGLDRGWRLIAGALLPAALLHGLFDFPLFLAENARTAPAPLTALAARWAMSPATLIEALSLTAVALECIAAAIVVRAINRMPLGDGAGFRVAPLRPDWLNSAIFAPATGGSVGGLLIIGALATLLLGVEAMFAGALIGAAFHIAVFCLCPATLGWALLSRPRDVPSAAGGWAALARRRGPAVLAATLVAMLAIAVGNPPRDSVLASLLTESGMERQRGGDLDGAIRNYGAAFAYRPRNSLPLRLRTDAEFALQDYDSAFADAERVLALDPGDSGAIATRGLIHSGRHEYAAAEADLDHALDAAPGNVHLLTQRARARYYLGKTAEAAGDLDRALTADPKAIEPRMTRIDFAFDRLDLDAVSSELDSGEPIDPQIGAFDRGRLRFHRGEFASASQAFAGGDNTNWIYPGLWRFLARARIGEDGHTDLAALAAKAPKTHWPYPVTQLLLGEKTLAEVAAAAANADQTCEFDFYAGEWLLVGGKRAAAAESLKRAAAECPSDFVELSSARMELRDMQPRVAAESPPALAPAAAPPAPAPSRAKASVGPNLGTPLGMTALYGPRSSLISAPFQMPAADMGWSEDREERTADAGAVKVIQVSANADEVSAAPSRSTPMAASCALAAADAPVTVLARVVREVTPAETLRTTRTIEREIGGKVSPAYLAMAHVVAEGLEPNASLKTLAAIPPGVSVKPGDRITLRARYRDSDQPCGFIPWTVIGVVN